jgi:hypothetical protein
MKYEEFSATCYKSKCDSYTWRKAKNIHKRQTNLLVSRMLYKYYDSKGSVEKNSLVVGLKGLDNKTNWLAVNRQ